MKFDVLLKNHVGEYGRYQKVMTFLVLLYDFFAVPDTIEMSFTGYKPEFYCVMEEDQPPWTNATRHETDSAGMTPGSVLPPTADSAPVSWTNGSPPGTNETCLVLGGNNTSDLQVKCDEWTYGQSVRTSTLVTEFDLVCDRKLLVSTTKMIYMIGFMLGVSLGGLASDRFGRRITCLVAFSIRVVARIISAFSVSYGMHAATRLLIGATHSSNSLTAYILATELVGPRIRPWILVLYHLNWTTGFAFLTPGVAYFIRGWRNVELAYTALHAPLLILFFILPESPRWLLAKGRTAEANAIIENMAKWNKKPLPPSCIELSPNEEEGDDSDQGETWLDFIKSREIIIRSSALFLSWFSMSGMYYGLAFGVDRMAGDLYLNVVIFGAVEYPAYLLILLLDSRLGRKWPIIIALFLCGLIMLGPMFVPQDKLLIATILSMIGKGLNSFAFCAIYMFTVELYPTTVRSIGIGLCSMMARVGSLISPFVSEMGQFAPLLYGAMSVMSAFALLILPETRKKPLPQSIKEMEESRSGFKCKCKSAAGTRDRVV